jgi:hypothetical protein
MQFKVLLFPRSSRCTIGICSHLSSISQLSSAMSLRINYSNDFVIEPRYRKKKGYTLDERLRNIRRLKKFDRIPAPAPEPVAEPEAESAGPEHISKTDTSEHDTQRAHAGSIDDEVVAGSTADRLPSYSESTDEPDHAPPAYIAGPSGAARRA